MPRTSTSGSTISRPVSQLDFQLLFESLPSRYIVMAADDPDFTILAENQAHADVAFVKIEDTLGRPLLEVFPDTSEKYLKSGVSDLIESLRKVIRTGKPDTMSRTRYDLKRPDGSVATRYWQLTHYPLFRGQGRSRELYAIFQATEDITSAVIADQRENNLTYLAKASTVLSASLDYHATLQSIAELMVPELADWCTIDMLTADEQSLELVALAHKDPAKISWARALRQKQGPASLDEPAGTPHVIRTGKPEYYPKVTDETLVASAKSKAELKILRELEISSVIIVPLIVDGHGLGAITMISTGHKRFYTQSDLEMATELANRASLAIYNARLYDEAQRELHERTMLEARLKQANDELEHRVDVRTSELEESNISLQRSNQELQDFAYVASHDLQEPLRKIQAFGNLLETEYADRLGDGADYLKRMRNAAARMSILIEDILEFSRVTTKGREFTSVNLRKVTKEVLEDLEVRITETRATVKVGELPTIHADAMQVRQLLQNLIANSLKFHREGVDPVISISSTVTTLPGRIKACRIEVKDNGMGFDEKYLGRIFAVFQRLHGRDKYEGTGIGLAVCRKIVERHGGEITAKSKPGKGSSFIITLPLRHKKGDNLL